MIGVIWLFFMLISVYAMYWYVQNQNATGALDETVGILAMREEDPTAEPSGIRKTR